MKSRELILGSLLSFALFSCNALVTPEEGTRTTNLSNIEDNQAKVLADNPVMIAGSLSVGSTDMNRFQTSAGVTITSETHLNSDCINPVKIDDDDDDDIFNEPLVYLSDCLKISNDSEELSTARLTKNSYGNWGFDAKTSSFLQVNSYYHATKMLSRYSSYLAFANDFENDYNNGAHAVANNKVFTPMSSTHNMFWFNISSTYQTWIINSRCASLEQNAVFSPAPASGAEGPSICMGIDSNLPHFAFSQDPTVLYHEMGHGFIQLMLNARNESVTSNVRADLGSIFYDEGGALGEGISDYFSYMMTDRPFIGEWAMQKYYNAGRPMTENVNAYSPNHPVGNIHAATVQPSTIGRLNYPHYVNYDPNHPTEQIEDIHYSGQIVSHFLVATTQFIKNECGVTAENEIMTQEEAENRVMYFVAQALGEIGDLGSELADINSYTFDPSTVNSSPFNTINNFKNNLVPFYAYEQTMVNNAVNFRRFFKIFSKHFNFQLVENECQFNITQQEYEQHLDSYGLLLFKTYDDDIDLAGFDNQSYYLAPTTVDSANRQKTVLVAKDFIRLPQADTDPEGRQSGFIFDDQTSVPKLIESITFKGQSVEPTTGLASTDYNNNNSKISPGEVVGLVLNLVNDSNSQVGGLQILANDWDHMRKEGLYYKPCSINSFPLASEGAASTTDSTTAGGCDFFVGQGYMNEPLLDSGSNYIDIDLNNNGFIDTFDVTIGGETYREFDIVDNDKNFVTNPLINSTIDKIKDNGLFDELRPVCLVQKRTDNETLWISQNEYRKTEMALTDNECLGVNDTTSFDGGSCLVRVLPGANQAYFSLLEPQKTWAETIQAGGSQSPTFNSSAAIIMEVNKWVSPGTTFVCRFRARFTNCDDCYHDPNNNDDDFPEYKFTGHEPFKVIDFQFTVID